MKSIFLTILLLFIAFQNAKAGVQSVNQTQLWYNEQLVDHQDALNNSTWSQRYWVIDQFYNNQTGPVLLYICGEYTCPGLPDYRLWPADLAQIYEGLILVLEHRFYGESMPFGAASLYNDNLKLLNIDQALGDTARFIEWIGQTGKHGVHAVSPWITIGGSYPGAVSAWFRYKYPHLTVGAIASSAVINAFTDYPQFDEQIRTSALRSGEQCAQAIHDVNFYAQSQVNNTRTSQEFKAQFNATRLNNGEFLFYYADIFVEKIQYGKRTWLCEQLMNKTVEENSQFIIKLANEENIVPYEYSSYFNRNQKYNPADLQNHRQWTFQYCSEFGWLQTAPRPYNISMRGNLVDMDMYTKFCKESFDNIPIFPTPDRVNTNLGGLDIEAFNIVFTNGVEDPWKWASLLKSERKEMIAIEIDCPDCAHCVDLYTPKESDAPELKKAREVEVQEISRWLKEYNQQNNYNFRDTPIRNQTTIEY